MPYQVRPSDAQAFQGSAQQPMPWMPRPGYSKEQYIVSEALRIMSIPAEVIRAQRPPVPYVLFPQTTGYDQTPLTISDVLDTNRWAPQQRSYMGGTVRFARHSDTDNDMMSGSSRNSISAGNSFG